MQATCEKKIISKKGWVEKFKIEDPVNKRKIYIFLEKVKSREINNEKGLDATIARWKFWSFWNKMTHYLDKLFIVTDE